LTPDRDARPVTDKPTVGARSRGSKRRRAWLKVSIGLLASLPAGSVLFRLLTDRLGANPIAEVMNRLGFWTLVLLLTTLACTPLKIVTGWTWPLAVRRMLGLFSFGYACLHLAVYLVLDQFFDWAAILEDIAERKFITIGFLGFLLLLPLAVTSTNAMVKRLGFPRWKRLHRLAYLAGVAGIVHFIWRVKVDLLEPLIFAGVLGLLLAIRVADRLRSKMVDRT
jgi:methionine sulfoxide reductase heme-binding subunit